MKDVPYQEKSNIHAQRGLTLINGTTFIRYICCKKLAPVLHNINANAFWLLPEKAVFWEQQRSLIVADLHLGKTGHFRKSGIAVPQTVYKEDLQRLLTLVQVHKPDQLIIVGDMFHSHANKEMDFFARWRNDFRQLHITLIKGNHDILHDNWYSATNIAVTGCRLRVAGFEFVHDPAEINDQGTDEPVFTFSGHIHPGVRIRSGSRQSLSFPCFYFSRQMAVLPAFSRFTGYAIIKPKRGDSVYAVMQPDLRRGEKGGILELA